MLTSNLRFRSAKPAKIESTPLLPGLAPVCSKPVVAQFDGGRLPETGGDLCSQPTITRLENLPGQVSVKRMMAAMITLFCDSFAQGAARLVLDIDDTED